MATLTGRVEPGNAVTDADTPHTARRRPVLNVTAHRHLLEDFVGFEMEVFYNNYSGCKDQGALGRYGDGWIELVRNVGKARQDSLLIPVAAIRMIRPIGPRPTPESILLRPADRTDAAPEPGDQSEP
mgnify:CR=1 FL=1